MDFTLAMNAEGRRWKGEDWKETCVQSQGDKGSLYRVLWSIESLLGLYSTPVITPKH